MPACRNLGTKDGLSIDASTFEVGTLWILEGRGGFGCWVWSAGRAGGGVGGEWKEGEKREVFVFLEVSRSS